MTNRLLMLMSLAIVLAGIVVGALHARQRVVMYDDILTLESSSAAYLLSERLATARRWADAASNSPELNDAIASLLAGESNRAKSQLEALWKSATLDDGYCGAVLASRNGKPVGVSAANHASPLLQPEDGVLYRRPIDAPAGDALLTVCIDGQQLMSEQDAGAWMTGARRGAQADGSVRFVVISSLPLTSTELQRFRGQHADGEGRWLRESGRFGLRAVAASVNGSDWMVVSTVDVVSILASSLWFTLITTVSVLAIIWIGLVPRLRRDQQRRATSRARADAAIRKLVPQAQGVSLVGLTPENLDAYIERILSVLGARQNELVDEVTSKQSELDLARQQLLSNQRLAFVGTMAAGVAHEIGQPMQTLRFIIGDIQERMIDGAVVVTADELAQIDRSFLRILRISHGMRDRARMSHGRRTRMDLAKCIRETVEFIGPLARASKVKLVVSGLVRPVWISGVESRLQQVVQNLVTNGIEALEHRTDGRVAIHLSVDAVTGKATFTVTDNGPGMDEETLQRATTWFFTTKPRGTGLGLSVCQNVIAEEHEGVIRIKAGDSGGTTVLVQLNLDATDGL